MHQRIAAALAAATLLLAACGGTPAAVDPKEIVTQGLEAMADLDSAHIVLSVDGSASIPDLGGELNLSGTEVSGDFDIASQEAHLAFSVPGLFGLTGELIQVGHDSYLKTPLTGETWRKSTLDEGDPVAGAMDPIAQVDRVRELLDREGVEVERLDDAACGEESCHAVRLTIPSELLSEAAEGQDMDPADVVGEALVLDLLFDQDERWLIQVSTRIAAASVGELTLTLALSDFNDPVDVEAPPADEVTEGGPLLPF